MSEDRPHVLFSCSKSVREGYFPPAELERLETFATWDWCPGEGGGIYNAGESEEKTEALCQRLGDVDALIVCHGAPRLDGVLMDRAPHLKFIGDLEGDRFAARIDLEAAWERDIRTVDTTNGSSYPVAEWALGLILISMRQAGGHFRRMIAGQTQ